MVFQADVTTLIQLYIIGVFVSFTLGQTGMVRHWIRLLRERRDRPRRRVSAASPSTLVGAVMTFSVLVIVTVTKFTHGAWIVFIIMPILFILMLGVNRYYRDVDKEIEVDPHDEVRLEGRPRDRARRPHAEAGAQGARLRDRRPARHASRRCTSRSTTRRPRSSRRSGRR